MWLLRPVLTGKKANIKPKRMPGMPCLRNRIVTMKRLLCQKVMTTKGMGKSKLTAESIDQVWPLMIMKNCLAKNHRW